MLGYICKYTPLEVMEALGEEMVRIEPRVNTFSKADVLMHPNICSYAKGVLEEFDHSNLDGIILTTCCDSIRRLYDVLKEEHPDKFIYLLDVPRHESEKAALIFEKRIRRLIEAYEQFKGISFSEKNLKTRLEEKNAEQESKENNGSKAIGILGARANQAIYEILDRKNARVIFDLTCTGADRKIFYRPDDLLKSYALGLLNQFPCMRMNSAKRRKELMESYLSQADGVIYHTVQFCDNYSYDYAHLKKWNDSPLLLLETDYTRQSEGQILTRIEAFLESLEHEGKKEKKTERKSMYIMGIDSGSTSTDAVIMDENKNIIAYEILRTGPKSIESAQKVCENVLKKAGLKREQIDAIVSTGYGRVSIPFADENVTEISCHGKGAHYFNPAIRTILDIGGQDSKAIHLDENGEVIDFVMNDKCAAGTGRFLEAIARTLELDIEEIGPQALLSTKDLEITSMCTVFAESEVISLIANNEEKTDIANGVCNSIASKAASLIRRVKGEEGYMMTGGVARNPGVVKAVEDKLNTTLYICETPDLVGAVGAALYGIQNRS